jgi:hypothetical protein
MNISCFHVSLTVNTTMYTRLQITTVKNSRTSLNWESCICLYFWIASMKQLCLLEHVYKSRPMINYYRVHGYGTEPYLLNNA